MSNEDPVNPKAEVLAKVFTGRLHVRHDKLDQTFALCRSAGAADAHWIELQRQLDSLADAAASFGFGTLAVHAGSLALRVADVLAQPQRGMHDMHDIDAIGNALAGLRGIGSDQP
jgi:hypothetical protein